GELPLERAKGDALQHRIVHRIGEHQLLDAIAAGKAGAGDRKRRNAVLGRMDDAARAALLFGEIAVAVGDDEAEVARAGLIDARIIDLVEDAMADREPDTAHPAERRADPALGARGPAPGNSRPAGRLPGQRHRRPPVPTAASRPARPAFLLLICRPILSDGVVERLMGFSRAAGWLEFCRNLD